MPKTVVQKFSFSELKIGKAKFFNVSPTKIFGVVNVGDCLANRLTFRPFLTLTLSKYLFVQNFRPLFLAGSSAVIMGLVRN